MVLGGATDVSQTGSSRTQQSASAPGGKTRWEGRVWKLTGEVEEPENTVIPQTGVEMVEGVMREGRSHAVQYCRRIRQSGGTVISVEFRRRDRAREMPLGIRTVRKQ